MRTTYNMNDYKQTIITNNPNITFNNLDDELKNTQSKITYICTEHGEAVRKALYLYEGRGCAKCAYNVAKIKKTFTTEDFIIKSNKIHNNKYDYSKTIYTGSSNKLTITCPHHGDFEQIAVCHMTKGRGCRRCGFISTAKKSYLNSINMEFITLYYIKCYGKGEVFYKIGIAKNGVLERYPNSESMPYLFEVLREIRGSADQLLEIEESIKLAIQPYTPLIPFGGSATECTLNEIDLDSYLEIV